ncbi:hypothetical protein BH24CHL9_BH24CHL9_15890 [soil metagenome]
METVATKPEAAAEAAPLVRGEPPPLHGGPLTMARFMRRHGMLNLAYARLLARLAWLKLRFRGRLVTDGIAFVGPGVKLEIGPEAKVVLGRWSWIGHGTKIRAHDGEVRIGAKTVLGQECTISSFQHVSICRECIVADRVMLIDFDHGVAHDRTSALRSSLPSAPYHRRPWRLWPRSPRPPPRRRPSSAGSRPLCTAGR